MTSPHGNNLVNKRISSRKKKDINEQDIESITLNKELEIDLFNIADGCFSPLKGFMGRKDFLKVLEDWTLEDGTVWPIPIILDVESEKAEKITPGEKVLLKNTDDEALGIIKAEEIFRYDTEETCQKLFGTTNSEHPGVQLFEEKGEFLVGGEIKAFPDQHALEDSRNLSPRETRVLFDENGWETIVGFQTRNVPHRAHEYLQKSALENVDGLLIQPKIGRKKEGDYRDEAIKKAYDTLIEEYHFSDKVEFSFFTSRMLYAGPREAVYDAIVRKNYGCTHFIVGRDHAGVGDYYDDFAGHNIFEELQDIGIEPLFYHYAFFCQKCDGIVSEKVCPHERDKRIEPSGTKIRKMIKSKEAPSEKIMRPEVYKTVSNLDKKFVGE
ncbi:MAG: sulfate adenylyltransferase [Nanohaloarchaea archaeon QH_8_44_6]|nr:MAG: sulfate adenylyltransferase [Nanohaloarchaea archaeon QH_8_44_6]